MKTKANLLQARLWSGLLGLICVVFPGQGDERAKQPTTDSRPSKLAEAIPWSQLGAKAGANYQGDGLAVTATTEGARLRCAFQKLEGEATREGLWLPSTVPDQPNDRFRVIAAAVGRTKPIERNGDSPSPLNGERAGVRGEAVRQPLPRTGTIAIDGQTVRFIRPGLVEEYTVSMDGVRRDFVVLEKPGGSGRKSARCRKASWFHEPPRHHEPFLPRRGLACGGWWGTGLTPLSLHARAPKAKRCVPSPLTHRTPRRCRGNAVSSWFRGQSAKPCLGEVSPCRANESPR